MKTIVDIGLVIATKWTRFVYSPRSAAEPGAELAVICRLFWSAGEGCFLRIPNFFDSFSVSTSGHFRL